MDPSKELTELRKGFVATLRKNPTRPCSLDIALETLQFLRKVILFKKYETITDLLEALNSHGRWICAMVPTELVIRNVLMMVAKLARDESVRIISGEPTPAFDSLNKLWTKSESSNGSASGMKLKKGLMQALNEVSSEMSLCCENIAARAGDLINPQDILVVHHLNESPTLAAFLESARATRKHRVLSVVHSSEFDSTPEFATPIPLFDVGSRMCEVTKVLLPGIAVFPDGSCLVPAGGLAICLSAQRHSVPVYVLAAFYKITPFFVPDPMMVNPNKAPGIGFSHALGFSGLVEVPRPSFDLLPASLVTLYISNSASILPSHVYRLIGDYYHPDDVTDA
ncbi:hypothetical protein RB195_004263 [Necator americanus]